MLHNGDLEEIQASESISVLNALPGRGPRSPLRLHLLCINHLLLLILHEMLLLVVLELLKLLELLQLSLLLEAELLLLLLLLRQEVSLPVVALRPHDVGACGGRRHAAGGVVVGRLPCVRRREAVMALGDIRVGPHVSRGMVQYLIWKEFRMQQVPLEQETGRMHEHYVVQRDTCCFD